jgi:hypothetical protein
LWHPQISPPPPPVFLFFSVFLLKAARNVVAERKQRFIFARALDTTPSRELLKRWLLALGCFCLLILVFCPPIWAFLVWSRVPEASFLLEVRRGASVLFQVEHPGAPIPDLLHSVIQWRLLFPLIGSLLGLSAPVFFSLAHLGCLITLVFIITVLRRRELSWIDCALATLVLGASSWFFTSVGWLGYFDSWLALGLLFVAFSRKSWPVWLACLWAPWVDERFVIAFPLALLCRWVLRASSDDGEAAENAASVPKKSIDWRQEYILPSALVAVFLLVRLFFLPSAPTAQLSGYMGTQKNLEAPVLFIFWGIWEGLRGAWVFAVAAPVLCRKRTLEAVGLALCALCVMAIGIFMAQDFSRSMTMVLPLALCGLLLAMQSLSRRLSLALRIAAPLVLLLPAHHVMSNQVNPIFYFYHELFVLKNPPQVISPDIYELQGIRAMEQGDAAGAEAQLLLAIKLSDNPSSPCKHRGMLRASQGRWAEAKADFAVMVAHSPDDPEGWFLRAQASYATGDSTAARSDFQQALVKAPATWAQRADVQRFQAKLNR